MLELAALLLAVCIGGFGAGAYLDIKTTEFPDWLPYSMIALALLIRGGASFVTGDFSYLTGSVMWGCGFLAFGLGLYYLKQWGDGDAWLLGALGFLFPDPAGLQQLLPGRMPFPLTLFFNFFIISLGYLVAYALAVGVRSPKVSAVFLRSMREGRRATALVVLGLLAVSASLYAPIWFEFQLPAASLAQVVLLPLLGLLLMSFFHYARAVEGHLFKRKVPAGKVRVGDVLIADKWRGLTAKEVDRLRRKGGEVWIKEGVRFAPVFILTAVVTLFFGSLWTLMFPAL